MNKGEAATRRLILMRHAKSDWYSGAGDDFSRPLNERGVRDARAMGQWLAEQDLLPDSIVSSPSARTRETLARLSVGAGTDLETVAVWFDELYHSSRQTIAQVLARHGRASGVMVLGHNPGLEEMLDWLLPVVAGTGEFAKVFPTAAIYILHSTKPLDQLSRGCCQLKVQQRPGTLAKFNDRYGI